ncbi:type I secretion system permease/ATPase [Halomonas sp. 1390]|uniref:type I secretion system permease/ATPase n=1 Tax=Halomonas sp. B23F22_3 TaxID=3459516 RepID=UPI00373FC5FE
MHPSDQRTDLQRALQACRQSFVSVGLFSLFINLLMLAPPLYMLQVYDRVLSTQSVETLLMLTLVLGFFFLVMGGLELVRSRILVRVGNRLDIRIHARLYSAMFRRSLFQRERQSAQPLNDLTSLRQFLTGQGLFAFFDAPWVPVYLGLLFLFHPWLGLFASFAAVVLLALAVANELSTKALLASANGQHIKAQDLATANLRNAEVLHAMGMLPAIMGRWADKHHRYLSGQSLASDRAGSLTNAAKILRLFFQSMILGLGAYLVLAGSLTPGMMIAGSIIMGRALAPVDQMIGSWKGFVNARGAYARLNDLLIRFHAAPLGMSLPPPMGRMVIEGVAATAPGDDQPILQGIAFRVAKGEHVGIIGPSAAGKSTLARVLLGVWPVQSGSVRLDGVEMSQWQREELGPWVGYLPQDIELFDGTIGENIARFGPVEAERVVSAARKAGVHEMILKLSDGYDTYLSSAGGTLSGGQRQRIGLARALYGDPVLVVLDEPNANLDDAGDRALAAAIRQLKADGVTLFVVSHGAGVLRYMDKLLVLKEGRMDVFGTRDKVLAQYARFPQQRRGKTSSQTRVAAIRGGSPPEPTGEAPPAQAPGKTS